MINLAAANLQIHTTWAGLYVLSDLPDNPLLDPFGSCPLADTPRGLVHMYCLTYLTTLSLDPPVYVLSDLPDSPLP